VPITVKRIAATLNATPDLRGGPVEIRDESTGTPIASGVPDPVTGDLEVLLPFDLFLQALAAGVAGGEAALAVPGAGSGTAAGQAGGAGVLTQELPLAGAAGGVGGGGGPAAQEQHLAGTAAGTAGPAGDPDVSVPGALSGAAAGVGDATAAPTVSAPLAGTAAGVGTGAESLLGQALPLSGTAAGAAGPSGVLDEGGGYDNHYAQGVLDVGEALWIRRTGTPGNYTGYRLVNDTDGEGDYLELQKWTSGSSEFMWWSDYLGGAYAARLEGLDGAVRVRYKSPPITGVEGVGIAHSGDGSQIQTGSAAAEGSVANYSTGSM
jgi:hypothetical protein